MSQEKETAVGAMETAAGWRLTADDKDDGLSKGPSLYLSSLHLWLGLYGDIKLENSNNYVQPVVKH